MNSIRAVANKELRTYFLSPVALIFIATFLLAALFSFFWVEGFFSRNVADIRPLFQWLPVLLIFLVPALGMRLWSEEERMGTIELLRTLPLRTASLVGGKFVSGLILVGVALALTLPVPLTVQSLGDLDWGPVWGGYLATLLVAGAYLSITMCISARTASQLVALIFGVVVCGLLHVLGSETVTSLFGNRGSEILRQIGAGSRFDSILRGVIDVRDLLYYVSITAFFLVLNGYLLETRRWSDSSHRAPARRRATLGVALLGFNLLAVNVLIAPVRRARVDLTEANEYSISPVTRDLLESLDEPLLIRGYFSQKTHPLLAPLVPRIRDMIEEYGAVGGQRVRTDFLDPTSDPELEKEANQAYGISSVPFQFADRHEASVVNSYFHVLVRYGDEHEALSFDKLIEIQVHGMEIEVGLRNLEYDLTRAVQKVVYGFQSIESVVGRLPAPAKLTAVVTEKRLPSGFEEVPSRIETVAEELKNRAGGRFDWAFLDPDSDPARYSAERLAETFGIRPYGLSLFSDDTFYLHLVLEVGEQKELIVVPEEFSEADIRKELIASLKRAGPGSLKTIGLVTGGKEPGAALSFRRLEEMLAQTYRVESVDLSDGRIRGDVDALLVLDPRELEESAVYAIDQFLMRGGSAVVAAGHVVPDPRAREGLSVSPVETGLDEWLAHHGVTIGKQVVLDPQNAAFPIPVSRNLGGFVVREIQMLRYAPFVDIRSDGMDADNPATSGLPGVVLHWPSPLVLKNSDSSASAESESPVSPESKFSSLLRSSEGSWLVSEFDPQPNFDRHGEHGWPVEGDRQRYSLGVSSMGPFSSFYAEKEAPLVGAASSTAPPAGDTEAQPQPGDQRRGHVIHRSPDRSRLVVLGSASFASDMVIELSRQLSEGYLANLQLVQNLVDWCLEDVELLKIRSRGTHARALQPTTLGTRKAYEWGNYLFALVAVVGLGFSSLGRRRNAKPRVLPDPRKGAKAHVHSIVQPDDRRKGAA